MKPDWTWTMLRQDGFVQLVIMQVGCHGKSYTVYAGIGGVAEPGRGVDGMVCSDLTQAAVNTMGHLSGDGTDWLIVEVGHTKNARKRVDKAFREGPPDGVILFLCHDDEICAEVQNEIHRGRKLDAVMA